MTIQWHLTTRPAADVLQVTGYLGDDAVTRFSGAVGWALARGQGPLLLDLSRLKGWSAGGRDAVAEAARRLAEDGRRLELVAGPGDPALPPPEGLTTHPDLAAALHAHSGQPAEGEVWHSCQWDA
ncbi:hypothetical protein [Streptacidiphilus neutrinimicus]|uniref:hypothetical protein n=1 Tax=Streptacidiphilus neutrinimicus TaxID=105420 RepID=UPI0005A65329|nr:hypothetical protein [Streptacidiphilus neutrinimicus]